MVPYLSVRRVVLLAIDVHLDLLYSLAFLHRTVDRELGGATGGSWKSAAGAVDFEHAGRLDRLGTERRCRQPPAARSLYRYL